MSTEYISPELFDLSEINSVNVGGHGGAEREISRLLPKWRASNSALSDFTAEWRDHTLHLEVKKQERMQWIDLGKWADLTPEARRILVMFIDHTKGKIDEIRIIPLGVLVDKLFMHEHYRARGWNEECFAMVRNLRRHEPKIQIKVPLIMRELDEDLRNDWQVLYCRVLEGAAGWGRRVAH
jgi:hypothetical protein